MRSGNGRYIVLLNDALKEHLAGAGVKERARLREKFEFLEQGFWDAGVRVKKLRGTSRRVVFEARLTRGERLLFTLGDHRGATAIYVWGLVRHDDIASEASRIVPRNAPFLDFEPLESEERNDLVLENIPADWLSQEDVEEKVPDDYGPQRWLVLDDEEWKRLLAGPDARAWEAFLFLTREQEDLLHAAPPVLLSGTAGSGKTTLSVYYLLRGRGEKDRRLFLTYNPLLKALAERVYAGLAANRAVGLSEPRFLVFRDLLRGIVEDADREFPPEKEAGLRQFTQIFNDHKDRKRFDPELVWEEIRSIIKGAKLPLAPTRVARLAGGFLAGELSVSERDELREHLVGLQDLAIARRMESFIKARTALGGWDGFVRAVVEKRRDQLDDCARALDEVVRQVTKAAADFDSPLLTDEEYAALGRKRAPSFLYDRRDIYGIARYYQERIEKLGLWDEIDLTKAAIRRIDGEAQEFSWDLLVCDEVQDLTDVQISLLFRLVSDPRAVVLTGDPRQIVNPSGFRWEEVKGKLYERGIAAPEIRKLSLNFRCAGSIVRLSNALLDLKAGLVGLSDTEMREEWKFSGRPPALLASIDEGAVLGSIDRRAAGHVVLARTPEARDRLKRALETELVFTIWEAKGLEFDTVLLWEFAADADPVWRSIASGAVIDRDRLPHVRHELALLYVAVTRARSTLIVYDGAEPSVIWSIPQLAEHLVRADDAHALAGLWRSVSTPAEWESEGDYYLSHEQYLAARECYRNAGNEPKQSLAGGLHLYRDGRFDEAGPLLEAGGDARRAAECYERVGAWEKARPLWMSLGEHRREKLCGAHVEESRGRWAAAAAAWDELGDTDRGLDCWEKAGAWDRVGRAFAARGAWERAAQLLEKAHLPLEAAACREKLGQAAHAADLYARGGDHAKAARLYRKAGETEKLLRCYRQMGDHLGAAGVLESLGDVRRAIEEYARYVEGFEERFAALLESIRPGRSPKAALKAGIRYAALGISAEAGPLLARGGALREAVRELEKSGDDAALARCLQQQGRYREAAEAYERSRLDPEEKLEGVEGALLGLVSAGAGPNAAIVESLRAELAKMRDEGRTIGALARARLLGDERATISLYHELAAGDAAWNEKAVTFFLDLGASSAAIAYARATDFTVSRSFAEDLIAETTKDPHIRRGEIPPMRELLIAVLGASLRGVPLEEGRRSVQALFDAAWGDIVLEQNLSRAGRDLVIAWRAVNVISRFLRFEAMDMQEMRPGVVDFVSRLDDAARSTGDEELAACVSYARDRVDFERRAALLPLRADNALLVGMSTARYREVVEWLVSEGRLDEAEYCARMAGDPGLSAQCLEKAGDLVQAARRYLDAKDAESALRCSTAAGDGPGIARAYERLGRLEEAIAQWEKIGRVRDAQRVRRKTTARG